MASSVMILLLLARVIPCAASPRVTVSIPCGGLYALGTIMCEYQGHLVLGLYFETAKQTDTLSFSVQRSDAYACKQLPTDNDIMPDTFVNSTNRFIGHFEAFIDGRSYCAFLHNDQHCTRNVTTVAQFVYICPPASPHLPAFFAPLLWCVVQSCGI
jgi:hypothetical protein